MRTFGVDISEWQEGISFDRMMQEGVEFAILRCGATGSSSGEPFTDGCFDQFYNEAKAKGLPVGVYYYSGAHDVSKARQEAEYVIDLLKGRMIDHGVWYDVEDQWHIGACSSDPGLLGDIITEFCGTVESAGHWCGIYSWPWLIEPCGSKLDRFDKWPCQWSASEPELPHGMWQFGGSSNELRSTQVAGLTVDQDYAYRDYPALMRQYGLGGYAKDGTSEKMDGPTETPQQRLVHWMLAQVGYVADTGKYTKYAEWIDETDTYNGPKNGYDWCDVFYDTGVLQTFGIDTGQRMLFQPKHGGGAGCWLSAGYYRDAGRFGSEPKIGAQIFFGPYGDEGHTGGVVGYDDTYVYTVEGNTGYGEGYSSGAVMKRAYLRGDDGISGYGYPDWDLAGGSDSDDTTGGVDYVSEPRNNRDGGKLDIDGAAGWNTVIDWQNQLGLHEDGEISDQWYGNDVFHWAVNAATHVESLDSGSSLVERVQALTGASVDGQWGRETSTKLQRFLIDRGYDCGEAGADGYFGRDSVRALQRSLNDGMWSEWANC